MPRLLVIIPIERLGEARALTAGQKGAHPARAYKGRLSPTGAEPATHLIMSGPHDADQAQDWTDIAPPEAKGGSFNPLNWVRRFAARQTRWPGATVVEWNFAAEPQKVATLLAKLGLQRLQPPEPAQEK